MFTSVQILDTENERLSCLFLLKVSKYLVSGGWSCQVWKTWQEWGAKRLRTKTDKSETTCLKANTNSNKNPTNASEWENREISTNRSWNLHKQKSFVVPYINTPFSFVPYLKLFWPCCVCVCARSCMHVCFYQDSVFQNTIMIPHGTIK